MWPRIQLPGTDVTLASFILLNFFSWVAFLLVGVLLTRGRFEFRRHWWWLFLTLIWCWFGSHAIARLIDGRGFRVTELERLSNWSSPSGYYGGPLLFLAATCIYILIQRIRAYPFLDVFAIAFSVMRAVSKMACFAAGCCHGQPTAGFWAVAFPMLGESVKRHPTQLYEASFHALSALALGLFYARGWWKGRLVMILGASYGVWRLLIELLRANHPVLFMDGPLTVKQVASLLVLTFCVTYLALDWAGARRQA